MNLFANLAIRDKFVVIVLPLLLAAGYFVFQEVRSNYQVSQDLNNLNNGIQITERLSKLVHEIQKERGNSSGFLANSGSAFGPELDKQRELTDEAIDALDNILGDAEYQEFITQYRTMLSDIRDDVDKIPSIRERVTSLDLTPNQAIDLYTEINTNILNSVGVLTSATNDKQSAEQLIAFVNFLKSKERAGIERAIGSQGFSQGKLIPASYVRFVELVSAQDAYADGFLSSAEQKYVDYYSKTVTGSDVEEVDRMRQALFANADLTDDPLYWFKEITVKINLLKKVEDYISDDIKTNAAVIAANANRTYIQFLGLSIILSIIDIYLLYFIVSSLVRNISTLSDFSKRVAKGDLSKTVNIPSKDEIGQFANTFNEMVGSLSVSRKELAEEKEKAEYLYETTYKQSEVVFANVQQGIFLLDDKFKISNLYSAAMEDIFQRKDIGGENFVQFMRPRLVPRDQDALEMFVKHLFNTEIDASVLDQLNPVENVQIYSNEDSGNIQTRHIEISFTRVINDDKINSVMVTVLDQTEAVLMQQHIKETEEKNKHESEQLLSILKIEPQVLKDFIDTSKKSLDSISARYENSQKSEIQSLITFTFNTVHNIKGNAGIIDLQLVADKFHEIEEALIELRGKDVGVNDFLKILYKINEVDAVMTNMKTMLRRIANVYEQMTDDGDDNSNDRFVGSLKKGATRMSEESGKELDFNFNSAEDFVLPERFKLPLKDVLIQLIRNTAAHGAESSTDRLSVGKTEKVNINVEITEVAGQKLKVNYKDDGRGIDLDKITKQAIQNGIVTEEEVGQMDTHELTELIFKDGLSTANKVSQLAGRGQGMSLVRDLTDKLKGEYTITSQKGESFEMTFLLPLENQQEKQAVQI